MFKNYPIRPAEEKKKASTYTLVSITSSSLSFSLFLSLNNLLIN